MFLPKNNNISIRVSPFISAVTRSSTGTRSIKRPTMAAGNKGGKKKAVDPFAKKDWYDIKAPSNDYIFAKKDWYDIKAPSNEYIFAKKDWYDIKNVFAEKAPSV